MYHTLVKIKQGKNARRNLKVNFVVKFYQLQYWLSTALIIPLDLVFGFVKVLFLMLFYLILIVFYVYYVQFYSLFIKK